MRPRSLSNGEIRKLLAAQLPADFADWLDFVAIGTLLAFTWDVPTYAFALLAVSMGLPYLLVGPVAGAVVDRMDVRRVLVWSNLGRGLATAAFFFAPNWEFLLALVALRSSVDTFFTPAKQSAIQALADPSERTSVNGISHAINQASKIAAPGLGGALLIWFAPGMLFLLNAGVSGLAALMALRLQRIARPDGEDRDTPSNLLFDVREGMNEVRGNRAVRLLLPMMAAGYFAMFLYDTFIAPLTRDLGFEPFHLGLALAAVGAGGVLGSLALSLVPELRQPTLWIASGYGVSAVTVIAVGASEWTAMDLSAPAFIGAFCVLGVTSAMALVPFRTLMQTHVPEARMGRVTALSEAANTTALLTAPFVGALLASAISIGAPFAFGGAVMLLVALRALMIRLD